MCICASADKGVLSRVKCMEMEGAEPLVAKHSTSLHDYGIAATGPVRVSRHMYPSFFTPCVWPIKRVPSPLPLQCRLALNMGCPFIIEQISLCHVRGNTTHVLAAAPLHGGDVSLILIDATFGTIQSRVCVCFC